MPADRQFLMRRSTLLVFATLFGLAGAPFPEPPATASCAAPYLDIDEPLVLERGASVTIEGEAFTGGGCQDSMSCSDTLGCESCEHSDPPPTPMEDVRLRLAQGGRSWHLDEADSGTAEDNQLGHVTWTFDVPAGARAGPAKLIAEHSQPMPIRIR